MRGAGATRHDVIRILFLGANPAKTTQLALDVEFRDIAAKLRATPNAARFEIEQEWAIRIEDLQAALLRHKPHILHFSGHGARDGGKGSDALRDVKVVGAPPAAPVGGGLVVDDGCGGTALVEPRALERLIAIVGGVRCVVLNACYSASQSEALRRNVDCVVGMADAIRDRGAIAFAWSFYQALGFGMSIATAFDLGKSQLELECLGQTELPQLVTREGIRAEDLRLLAAPRRRWLPVVVAATLIVAALCSVVVYRALRSPWRSSPPPRLAGAGSHASVPSVVPAGMAWLPAVDLEMGTPADRLQLVRSTCAPRDICAALDASGYWAREAQRSAHVDGFFLDRREVTAEEFTAWANSAGCRVQGEWLVRDGVALARVGEQLLADEACVRTRDGYAATPLTSVTWKGASQFCAARRAALPTGDQWERAAHALGDHAACATDHAERAGSCAADQTPEGILDLVGNVAEWTRDIGDAPGTHVVRGGSFATPPIFARPAGRRFLSEAESFVGFRCASSPQEDR